MNSNELDEKILAAIVAGHGTREKLMLIDALRLSTWSVVGHSDEARRPNRKQGRPAFTQTGLRADQR